MPRPLTRREALKRIGAAGTGFFAAQSVIHGRSSDIIVAGQPVEVVVSSVSPATVRISVLPLASGRLTGVPADGAIVAEGEGRSLARRTVSEKFEPVRAGNLVVRFEADPPTLHIDKATGGRCSG
jgi:hypothetical protein